MKYLILVLLFLLPLSVEAQGYYESQCETLATNVYLDLGSKTPPVFNYIPKRGGSMWAFNWYGNRYSLNRITNDMDASLKRQGAVGMPQTLRTNRLNSGEYQIAARYRFNGAICGVLITTPDSIIMTYSKKEN